MFYRKNKMGLVSQILDFFSFYSLSEVFKNEYQSIEDLMRFLEGKGMGRELRTVLAIVKKFEQEGFILRIGQKGSDPVYGATYVAQTISTHYQEYGAYDFYYYGFAAIRRHFLQSVLPIDVTANDGSKDIGTCFAIDSHRLLTARHCIEGKRRIVILDPMGQLIIPSTIWIPTDGSDLALIEMNYYNYSSIPHFKIENGHVLDEVLTMGYPPIPGFDAVNVSDMSHIGAAIKVSEGRIVAEERTLFEEDSFFLINAKVKGGNSGGPIINNLGYTIGMIVMIPMDSGNQDKLDHLGYGVGVTGKKLKGFLSDVNRNSDKVSKLPLITSKLGFSTL